MPKDLILRQERTEKRPLNGRTGPKPSGTTSSETGEPPSRSQTILTLIITSLDQTKLPKDDATRGRTQRDSSTTTGKGGNAIVAPEVH